MTAMGTLPLLHAIKRSHQTSHMDGLMTMIQPMHPRRIAQGFTHLVHETARRLQDPTDGTRHVFVYHRFVLGAPLSITISELSCNP